MDEMVARRLDLGPEQIASELLAGHLSCVPTAMTGRFVDCIYGVACGQIGQALRGYSDRQAEAHEVLEVISHILSTVTRIEVGATSR